MPQILSRKELDTRPDRFPGFGDKGHNVVYLYAECHNEADQEVSYDKNTGLLKIDCAECGLNIAFVRVADDNQEFVQR